MRELILVFLIFHFTSCLCNGQTLVLTDSTFTVGAQLTRHQIYNGNCQIDSDLLPFIDSLANFLMQNERIAIIIEFHGDVQESDDFEKRRAEICGKGRLQKSLKYHYPQINQNRILYVCYGSSQALYPQEEISKIQDRSKQLQAYRKNRRTVVKIAETDFVDK